MPSVNESALMAELTRLLAQHTGLHIPDDSLGRFEKVMHERAARYGSLADYRDFLQGSQADSEWEGFVRDFTSRETYFFRDHGQFDLLRLRLLPELIARHRADKTLRLWSAGCASGEEAYSLAMLLDMLLPEQAGWNILILGTDIDSHAIVRAEQGDYGEWSFRMVPDELKQRYFKSAPGTLLLDERIRNRVTFRVDNLLGERDAPWHDMDLILCRNVFIYFEHDAVFRAASRLAQALHKGGYLMTAHTELIGHAVPELESRLFAEGVVYQRRGAEVMPAPPVRLVQIRQQVQPRQPPRPVAQQAHPAAPVTAVEITLLGQARTLAHSGEFEQAEELCGRILSANALATPAYFLMAQLVQARGEFQQAMALLNKVLYLDPRSVAAHLELAALCERANDIKRAHILRRAAFAIVSALSADTLIEQYGTTAGELAGWLAQWEAEPS